MNSQKVDNQLNLALDLPNSTREKTADLDVGFNAENDTWELIIKYNGSLRRLEEELGITAVPLINEYAVITIPANRIDALANYEEVEFIEKPKRLFQSVNQGISVSCINPLQSAAYNLFGEGVLVAFIDSGIDYSHPDFRNDDGTTRIMSLWDQSINGNPPSGYATGTLYTREQINEALSNRNPAERLAMVPSVDISGHGTHVAGIAAGNGRASGGTYKGVASKSELLVVKLGNSLNNSFPRTTQLMEALDFVIKRAIEVRKPIAINVSFGNNYGSHDGRSLLEAYINDVANLWKISIIVGSGNEGSTSVHTSGFLTPSAPETIEISVDSNEPTFNLQLWKNYYDDFDVVVIHPGGLRVGPLQKILGTQQFIMDNTEIFLYYGEPTPTNPVQELYFEFIPRRTFVDSGIWKIQLIPKIIVRGNYDFWLPSGGTISPNSKFLKPTVDTTLTIPSTAYRVITVGAYDSNTDSLAYFSGRGYTRDDQMVKPDLAAPGVNIMSASPGGGYTTKSGTSMATPFVTGSVALLMEWGIVQGNDAYMYGEKVKAVLIAGTRKLAIERTYPNNTLGYGALCLRESLQWARMANL